MESNKDEAVKCLAIAQKHRNAGNFESARRFCQKSLNLFSTPEATKLLEIIDSESTATPSSSTSSSSSTGDSSNTAFSSSAETHPSSSGTRHRHADTNAKPSGSTNGKANGASKEAEKKREYTPEQAAVVKRIRACKVTEYYEILSLKKDCEEVEVKKAYRKVLSDPQKRAAYDQHGSDPESRFGGGTPSYARRSQSFGGSPFGPGGGFEGEMSPEDLFNMFFGGGGMGQTSFGGGPVFTASFGPGGFRPTRVRRTNAGQQQAHNAEPRSVFMQLLPLIILFGFSLLNALPSLFGSTPTPDPRFSFNPSSRYNVERHTGGLGIKYHVNAAEFSGHPIAAELARNDKQTGPELRRFEGSVEKIYTQDLYSQCQRGLDRKERLKNQEVGVFGFGTDWDRVRQIEEEPISSCDELRKLGLLK
ncbi:hypothetical protein PHLCEN_2v6050 [Hermanssonia centrifuga]|uniref:DUF1977 domain-containing protein n=1 Tax=Hermanssonia centrifuga TaxID=98765 RepID=A0A2R6P0S5_9APHY|nr:hypothetical protein PHLCEN_2v6050 [Hermanssonia centrifuga]